MSSITDVTVLTGKLPQPTDVIIKNHDIENNYSDVIMGAMASQITTLTIVCPPFI